MATKHQISTVLKDAETNVSFGVFSTYAKATNRALKIAELTGRSVVVESREIIYPDLPF